MLILSSWKYIAYVHEIMMTSKKWIETTIYVCLEVECLATMFIWIQRIARHIPLVGNMLKNDLEDIHEYKAGWWSENVAVCMGFGLRAFSVAVFAVSVIFPIRCIYDFD